MLDDNLIKAAAEYNAILKSAEIMDENANAFDRINKCNDLLVGYQHYLSLYNGDFVLFNLYTSLSLSIDSEDYECAKDIRHNILTYVQKNENV